MPILKMYGKKDERSWLNLARALANSTQRIWIVYYDGTRYHMCTDDKATPIRRTMVCAVVVPYKPKCMVEALPFSKDVG